MAVVIRYVHCECILSIYRCPAVSLRTTVHCLLVRPVGTKFAVPKEIPSIW